MSMCCEDIKRVVNRPGLDKRIFHAIMVGNLVTYKRTSTPSRNFKGRFSITWQMDIDRLCLWIEGKNKYSCLKNPSKTNENKNLGRKHGGYTLSWPLHFYTMFILIVSSIFILDGMKSSSIKTPSKLLCV